MLRGLWSISLLAIANNNCNLLRRILENIAYVDSTTTQLQISLVIPLYENYFLKFTSFPLVNITTTFSGKSNEPSSRNL